MKPIKVLIVDDHQLVREALSQRLASEPEMAVVGSAGNAEEAITLAVKHRPVIVLMDIEMPGMLCFDAARRIMSQNSEAKIIFLSAFFNDRYIEQALAVQAGGYLTKHASQDNLIDAIQKVAAGEVYFSEEVLSRIVLDARGVNLAQEAKSRASTLTAREIEILRYIARGMTKKEIASAAHISVKTVEGHSLNLMNKLDIHDRVELARFAIREGLAEA